MKEKGDIAAGKKDKLTIISEMDELKVIANNHLIMKRYSEAIKSAEKIINLALEVKMDSVIREQEDFITGIYKIVETDKLASIILDDFTHIKFKYDQLAKKNKFLQAHNLVQEFKQKYDEYYDVRLINSVNQFLLNESNRWNRYNAEESEIKLLEPLEIQFNSYIHTNNIPLARDTLDKAKSLLEKVSLDYIVEKWKKFESEYLELHKDYQLKGDFESKLDTIAELTDEYKFQEARSLLSSIMKITEERGFIEYKNKFEAKKRNIEDAETKYTKLLKDIADLEHNFKRNMENNQFETAKEICDQIIKIARFIDKQNLLTKYEKQKETIKERMREYNRFISLKTKILKESEDAVTELEEKHFNKALEKYTLILHHIQEYFEE